MNRIPSCLVFLIFNKQILKRNKFFIYVYTYHNVSYIRVKKILFLVGKKINIFHTLDLESRTITHIGTNHFE